MLLSFLDPLVPFKSKEHEFQSEQMLPKDIFQVYSNERVLQVCIDLPKVTVNDVTRYNK